MWWRNSKQFREETSKKISWGHWFALFNILWAITIGSRYAFIIDWPDTLFGKIYFFISLLGHFSFVIFTCYLLIIFPLSFLIKNERTFRGLTVIFSTIGLTLLLVDTEVFFRFNLHLSALVWNLLVNPDNGELSRVWQIFFAPMPIILLVQMLFSRWSWQKLRSLERQKWLRPVGIFFLCSFITAHLIYAWADAFIYRPITMQKSNFPLSYPMTARSFLEKHGFLDKEEYSQRIAEQGRLDALKLDYPKHPLVSTEQQNPNLIFITLSGLRSDAIVADKMPNLSAFAENATQYQKHYSSGNQENTGLMGLFYGLSATYLDSVLSHQTQSVLLQQLQQRKYQIGVFSSSENSTALFRQALFPQIKNTTRKLSNEQQTADFTKWLEQNKNSGKPLMGYLNLVIPTGLSEQDYLIQLDKIDQLLALTFPQIADTDIVIITASHGYIFANQNSLNNRFTEESIRVPLIISWNALMKGKVEGLTSHVDILPTLMKHAFKVNNPISDYSQGQDLLTEPQHNWALVANYRWNAIITADGTQYHIDKKGNYQKYNQRNQLESSNRPPLGLFLEVFNKERSFINK
ncbi:DUF3413 domain-containing protein [[Haemophilus] felis]|uniref:DUF3413 domain-containing protein n=1 Tax=[Haemophilus] felis TaxID=123822 RepID=A0A1T0BBT1_9PAST|nr:DUF3413 domain-containing protein [[Haemophilus] felis]NBI41173.1 DUF3413 domain-containing protein [[Haemophilus] felis]OOS07524.1 hypothetical protein B0188_00130 [[Haemophilus] felis]